MAPVIWRALKVIILNVVHAIKCNWTAKKDDSLHIGQYGSYICKPNTIVITDIASIHCNNPVLLSESVRGLPVTLWKSPCKIMQLSVHHLITALLFCSWILCSLSTVVKFFVTNLKGRDQLRDLGVDGGSTGYTQKNGTVSKVNKKFISHLTWAELTRSAAATVQVSHALPAFCFSCLLRGQFSRWRCSRKRLSVCSVLRCPDLWLQCSVSFVHGLEKTH